jgi:hypothetical protein
MKSKTIVCLLIASMCVFALCLGNQEQTAPATTTTQAQTPQTAPPATIATNIPLSNLQIEACNSADAGGTCISKLKDFGIVSLEECCKYMKKCC